MGIPGHIAVSVIDDDFLAIPLMSRIILFHKFDHTVGCGQNVGPVQCREIQTLVFRSLACKGIITESEFTDNGSIENRSDGRKSET